MQEDLKTVVEGVLWIGGFMVFIVGLSFILIAAELALERWIG
jgi:hypothetical protein